MASALKASDVMQTDVVTADPSDSLQETLSLMLENHVSGLPVIDRKDRCVGIISATDILNLEREQAEHSEAVSAGEIGSYFDPDRQQWESMRVGGSFDEIPDTPVSEAMSSDVVFVKPGTPLTEVADLMLGQGIHRVLVLDEERYLHGIIAATDFVKVYAQQA